MTGPKGTLGLYDDRGAADDVVDPRSHDERRDQRPAGSLTVSELVLKVERALFQGFPNVTVVGEVASVRPWRNGNVYFELKDPRSTMNAVIKEPTLKRFNTRLEEGARVVVTGRVALSRGQGKVQINIARIEPVGEGVLQKRLDELTAKLRAEGLFDPARKRAIPRAPSVVGVVTSLQGAVLRDVIKVLRRRNPRVSIVVSSTRVQGEGADRELSRAILELDRRGKCDVIIIGRGGGAKDDLAAFQSELVVRAIAATGVPVISSVGHETDVTLADLVADVRGATPTHAAQLATAEVSTLKQELAAHLRRLVHVLHTHRDRASLKLARLEKRLPDPRLRLLEARDDLEERARVLQYLVDERRVSSEDALRLLTARLDAVRPDRALADRRRRLASLDTRLAAVAMRERIATQRRAVGGLRRELDLNLAARRRAATVALSSVAGHLDALSPLKVLDRGFVLATKSDGTIVGRLAAIPDDGEITLRFVDGTARARIDERRALTNDAGHATEAVDEVVDEDGAS